MDANNKIMIYLIFVEDPTLRLHDTTWTAETEYCINVINQENNFYLSQYCNELNTYSVCL